MDNKIIRKMKRIIYMLMVIAGVLISTVFSGGNVYATVSDNTANDEGAPADLETPASDDADKDVIPAAEPGEKEPEAKEPEVKDPEEKEPYSEEGAPVEAPEDNDGSDPENPDVDGEGEPPVTYLGIPSNNESADPMGIDGYFDDWEEVPESQIQDISYGSHQHVDNIREHHSGKMIIRDGYVYVNIQMSDLYKSQIPTQYLGLAIDGQERWFNILGKDDNGNPDWGRIYSLDVGRNTGLGIFCNGDTSQMPAGDAAVTTTGSKGGDAFEFRMSISDLEKFYGLPDGTIANGAKVEFYSPNIGPQKVTAVGTPTGSRMGIGLSVSIAGLALMLQDLKRKKK